MKKNTEKDQRKAENDTGKGKRIRKKEGELMISFIGYYNYTVILTYISLFCSIAGMLFYCERVV